MRSTGLFSLIGLGFGGVLASSCPPVQGSIVIDQPYLYPEGADWDPIGCKLYLCNLYNCSISAYDPYTQQLETIQLPSLLENGRCPYNRYHVGGIDFDPSTGQIKITANSPGAFNAFFNGNYSTVDYNGPNRVFIYDPPTTSLVADVNLRPAQRIFRQQIGRGTSGFQDLASDTAGNSYVVGTLGNSIARIHAKTGAVDLWYRPRRPSYKYGFGGVFELDDILVVSDTLSQGLVTFDTREQSNPTAHLVPIENLPDGYNMTADGLFAPPRYGGEIALWSEQVKGTTVLASKDGWRTARYLGTIENDFPGTAGQPVTAAVEMGGSVYQVVPFFQTAAPKPKRQFPLIDITGRVDRLAQEYGICV